MDIGLLAEILSAVLAVLAYYFHNRYSKATEVLDDLGKAFEDTSKAIEDGKLTPEEAKQLIEDWKRVVDDFRGGKS